MGVAARFLGGLATQLARPEGVRGRVVARGLNLANRRVVGAAIEAAEPAPGMVAADIGFGGGVGLALLLARVGPDGHVHGVELSDTMLEWARRRFRLETRAGSLALHKGSITGLPLTDASLDTAITVNTVYFVADLDRAFTELARVLRPSGRVVVGLRDPDVMAGVPLTQHGFTIRSVEDVRASLLAANLSMVDQQRIRRGNRAFHLLVAGKPSA